MPPRKRRQISAIKCLPTGLTAAALAAGAAACLYAWLVEPNWLQVSDLELNLPRLPAEFDGYRIAHISDIHAGGWMPDSRMQRIADLVNSHHPDLIAVTGDFVTRVYHHAHIDIVPYMKQLHARDGVVAVLGNHDYWGKRSEGLGPEVIRRAMHHSGMIDLNNRFCTISRNDASLHIAGVDSIRAGRDRLQDVLKCLPTEGAAILLAHEPDFADTSSRSGRFDLQLSGHSHGGQVYLPIIGAPRLPPKSRKYPRGLYNVGGMLLYTNRGLGMVGLPIRFGARPEVSVLTLQSPKADS